MNLSNDELKQMRELCEAAMKDVAATHYETTAHGRFFNYANPTRVLSLLDEIERLQKIVQMHEDMENE